MPIFSSDFKISDEKPLDEISDITYQFKPELSYLTPPQRPKNRNLLEHTGNYQWCSMKVRRAN